MVNYIHWEGYGQGATRPWTRRTESDGLQTLYSLGLLDRGICIAPGSSQWRWKATREVCRIMAFLPFMVSTSEQNARLSAKTSRLAGAAPSSHPIVPIKNIGFRSNKSSPQDRLLLEAKLSLCTELSLHTLYSSLENRLHVFTSNKVLFPALFHTWLRV